MTEMTDTLLTVEEGDAGRRLDAFLALRLADLSRVRLQALIKAGHVRSPEGVVSQGSRRVKPGEAITVHVPPAVEATPRSQAIPLEVLFEDEHLLVLVKPAGLVAHPAPGHADGTLVNALLAHCGDSLSGIGGVRRPGIVHRLDRDVSGVLVVAKHDKAHLGLSAQFTLHTVGRTYEAIVWGVPGTVQGRIDRPLGRDPKDRLRMAVVTDGKRAVTNYRVLGAAAMRAAHLEVQLETGRTHQIRVHLTSLGHPILGDRLYGRRPSGLPGPTREAVDAMTRLALHARELAFTHPITGMPMTFAAPPPALFQRLLEVLAA